MKKILKIILIVFVLLIILAAGFVGYLFLQREREISKLPDYYQDLAERCKEKRDGCCLDSVKIMAGNKSIFAPFTTSTSTKSQVFIFRNSHKILLNSIT